VTRKEKKKRTNKNGSENRYQHILIKIYHTRVAVKKLKKVLLLEALQLGDRGV
jgi:hypothetical protein